MTGKTYEDVIREEILEPLKMRSTCFWNEVGNKNNVAGKLERFPDSLTRRNWGCVRSGGIHSTPMDLYKFWKGATGRTFIPKACTEARFKRHYRTASGIDIVNFLWKQVGGFGRSRISWKLSVARTFPADQVMHYPPRFQVKLWDLATQADSGIDETDQ